MSTKEPEYYLIKVKKEKLRLSRQRYYEKNKELIRERIKNKKREQYQNDPVFREKEKARNLARHNAKKNIKIRENIEALKIIVN